MSDTPRRATRATDRDAPRRRAPTRADRADARGPRDADARAPRSARIVMNRIEFDAAAGTDGTTRDDAVARIRAEYATYARKSRAVHEAKLAMARAAVKRAERANEGTGAARRAAEALERARDEATRELERDMAQDIAEAEAEMEESAKTEAATRTAIERHLETERAKAAEAEATTRERLRPGADEEESATYEEADDYRTTSPEGKGLREVTGEDEGEARASAFSRVRGLLTKKASVSRASEDVAEVAAKTDSGRVSMAALAPKPALMSELAPEPVESTAPEAGATDRAFDPHDALLRRLKSSSLKSDSGESRARAAPAEPAGRSARETLSVAPRAQKISDPFAPPRGLGAAINAIVENKGSATAAQSIESAFGIPTAPEVRASVAPKSILEPSRARDDVFAPETKRIPPELPAAPVRVEPNPYVMSKQDLRPAPRRRVGFPSAYRNAHSAQAPIETHAQEAPRDQYSPDANVGATTEDAARRRGRDLALTPSNQLSPPITANSSESSAQRPELKPKIPRMLVPSSPFKISEVRNLFSFARHGRYGELKKLIMKGVPLDARDEMGNSALIIACQNGQGRCVKLLIRSGADPNVQNKHGNTSLHFSLHFRFDAISDFLQRHGGLTNIQNHDGQTCYEFVG